MAQSFDLPVDVPWKWIAGSADMMAPTFGVGAFPPAWRSSLAIYAYEPSPANLPTELCDQKITYLKVTCSITGYQPTADETAALVATSPAVIAATQAVANAQGVVDFFTKKVDEAPNPAVKAMYEPLLQQAQQSLSSAQATLAAASATSGANPSPIVANLPGAGVAQTPFTLAGATGYSNPYAARSDGLTFIFTVASGMTPGLPVAQVPGTSTNAIQIPNGATLEIDLPPSTNVSLQLYASTGEVNTGTITAYDDAGSVFETDLSSTIPNSFTSVNIDASASVTKMIIASTDDDTYLSSVSYSSLQPSDGSVFGDFTDAYFACYGALLNVSVFPSVSTVPQTSAVVEPVFNFDGSMTNSPNPFRARADGLAFSMLDMAGPVASLPVVQVPGNTTYALQIPNGSTLEIDLPLSMNIALDLFASTGEVNAGTISAFNFQTLVSQTSLSSATPGTLSTFVINPATPVTKILIVSSDDDTYLSGLQYSSVERPTTIADYPHIIDFEPKTRDLYQASTDQNEVLTASTSDVKLGKSMSNTSSQEMGITQETGYNSQYGSGKTSLTGKWGSQVQDTTTTNLDQSRERRETQGSTTNITQQYNLLTGYHAGTNRATFLSLPRPHTLQATDYRTFIRGLRMLEGVQEFFLVVSRATTLPGICIEAVLETAHFPENVTQGSPLTPVGPPPATKQIPFSIVAYVPGHNVSTQCSANTVGGVPQNGVVPYTLPPGWIFDTSQGDPSSPGVSKATLSSIDASTNGDSVANTFNQAVNNHVASCQILGTNACQFTVMVYSQGGNPLPDGTGAGALFSYTIYAVQEPTAADNEPVVVSDFIVTSRELAVCINSCATDNCIQLTPTRQVPYAQSPGPITQTSPSNASGAQPSGPSPSPVVPRQRMLAAAPRVPVAPAAKQGRAKGQAAGARVAAALKKNARAAAEEARTPTPARAGTPPAGVAVPPPHSSIVYESKLRVPAGVLKPAQMEKSRTPAAREMMQQVKHHLLNSWRSPRRRPHGSVGFLESDYVCQKVRQQLAKEYRFSRIANLEGISPQLVGRFGTHSTVDDVLKLDLHLLCQRARLDLAQAIALRRVLLWEASSQVNTLRQKALASRVAAGVLPKAARHDGRSGKGKPGRRKRARGSKRTRKN
jgi:hypothetical protein